MEKVYGKKRTPYDDFGRQLFDDWDEIEWQKFDNFMIHCLQVYIKDGVIPQEGTNIRLKRLIADTHKNFADWAQDNIKSGDKVYNTESFDKFLKEFSHMKDVKDRNGNQIVNPMKWSRWLKKYAEYLECDIDVRNTGGKGRFIIYIDDKTATLGATLDEKTATLGGKNATLEPKIAPEEDKLWVHGDDDEVELPF